MITNNTNQEIDILEHLQQLISEQKFISESQQAAIAKLEDKISKLESSTIVLNHNFISDFQGLQENSKKIIEANCNQFLESEEAEFLRLKANDIGVVQMASYVKQNKKRASLVPAFSMTQYLSERGLEGLKGNIIGNYINKSFQDFFGYRFNGGFPESLKDTVDELVKYYLHERKSLRKV
jgi:hypothetical protein